MKKAGYLEEYQLKLTVFGPLFVGSGKNYSKIGYLFDPVRNQVAFIREEALFHWLVHTGNVDGYERELRSSYPDLEQFLQRCGISEKDRQALIRYEVNAGMALDAGHTLKEIQAFQRDGQGRAYVPGSSVKGALRTALLYEKLLTDSKPRKLTRKEFPNGRVQEEIDETLYFHTLYSKGDNSKERENAINSILRGISIADSQPVPDTCMTLAGKRDVRADGRIKSINVVRECIAPGTVLTFRLTLDRSILRNELTIDDIKRSIASFSNYYRTTYRSHFPKPRGGRFLKEDFLVLGGGSGFFGKTAIYPFLGYQRGLTFTAAKLSSNFRNHKHELDEEEYRTSPHCLKYTQTADGMREFGICKVEIS